MERVIKAQLYQMVHDKLFWGVSALITAAVFNEVFGMSSFFDGGITGNDILFMGMQTVICLMVFFMIYVQCCDRKSKMINCDILSGSSRSEVVFGRYLAAFIMTAAFSAVIYLLPTAIFTAFNGWDEFVGSGDVAKRLVSALFIMFRLSAEVTLAAVLIRKMMPASVLCFGVGLAEIAAVFDRVTSGKFELLFGYREFVRVMSFEYSEQFDSDGNVIASYDSSFTAAETAVNVVLALVIGVTCLALAKRIFCKRDFD